MKKTNLIPRCRAKTAMGLLSFVKKLILEEPRRYDQGTYIERLEDAKYTFLGTGHFPACGTIGCVAGWVCTVKEGDKFTYGNAGDHAQRILGLTTDQADELFDGGAAYGKAQSKEHAENGAKHIERFQKAHAAQLKAQKV